MARVWGWGGVGPMVDGSPSRLARRDRKAPAMVVHRLWSGTDRGKLPFARVSGRSVVFRTRGSLLTLTIRAGTKGGGRPSQVLCGPAEPIAAEIHQPWAPRHPRILAMVQGVTQHFEQNQHKRRTPATGAIYPL